MSDTNSDPLTAPALAPPARVKIVPDIPIFFTDGVVSHSYAPGVAKFYFYRTDSDPFATGPNTNNIVAQAVMSAEGFARMTNFFNHRLKLMIRDGAISKEAAEQIASFSYEEIESG